MTTASIPTILLVDDEVSVLHVVRATLEDAGYSVDVAHDGPEGLAYLHAHPSRYHAVLLDLIMPTMPGLDVLAEVRSHPRLKHIPVIIHTGAMGPDDISAGLAAGAHYYLTKPAKSADLFSILSTAIRDYRGYLTAQEELASAATTLQLLHSGTFRFQTMDEARRLASLLAHAYPDPARVITGLLELLLNAVEHGNLAITYEEKSRLLENEHLDEEIVRRLNDPAYRHRYAVATFIRHDHAIHLSVIDEGRGFDWRPYLHLGPERVFDTHGRGIATAKLISFDTLEYHGTGNHVEAIVQTPQGPSILKDAA